MKAKGIAHIAICVSDFELEHQFLDCLGDKQFTFCPRLPVTRVENP